jgi:hypothetical protein
MTNEEKLKLCIVPSNELREAVFTALHGEQIKKVQQRFYNYDGTHFVWRDIPVFNIRLFDEFSKTVMFE